MVAIDPSVVAGLPLFRGLAASQIKDTLSTVRSRRVAKDEHVFDQGAEAQSFFLLLHGHVRAVKTTPDGDQVAVRYVSPGELFGVAPAIGLATYPATAIAAVDSVVLVWPASRGGGLARSRSLSMTCSGVRRRSDSFAACGKSPL
jgi:CRP/FNR family transcriptional regulator, nitrogen oxide reductase regulator